jgi:DNA polymerase-3 subunit alpha
MTDFVSLHNQTDYSILDSLVSTKALFKRAKELGQTAVAITDHGTLAAAWEAWKVSKDIGVKLIIGCECYFQNDATNVNEKFRHLVLLA